MPVDLWSYRASVVRIVDGDTVDVDVDLGFHVYVRVRLRLAWIDAAELRGPERALGQLASGHLRELIEQFAVGRDEQNRPVIYVRTQKDRRGKYGRWLATLFGVNQHRDLIDLNLKMYADGYARLWEEGE